MAEDYYQTLGVDRKASPAEIQKAYRKLARKYHPDMNPDDKSAKENFQKVQQAYDVLNDPEKRQKYDQYGSAFEQAGGAGPGWESFRGAGGPGGVDFDLNELFGGAGGPGGAAGFEEILRQFGGGRAGGGSAGGRRRGRAQPARTRGADVEHELPIPFTTSILGGEARLSVRRADGHVESITVKIKPGIADGKKMRLRGQGEESPNGGPPGDLLITIRVGHHPCFRRHGDDLEVSVPVTVGEAALGAKVDVPTPKGAITLKIPPGTSSGKRLRVKGMGAPHAEGAGHGDLYAEIQIVLPDSLDKESQDLVRQFEQRNPQTPRSALRW
jgi:DnaJ-class molecular chaperone